MQNLMKVKLQHSALDILLNEGKNKTQRRKNSPSMSSVYKRDELTFSKEAVRLQKAQQATHTSKNINIDKNINISSYFQRAMEQNMLAISNAGDSITSSSQNSAKYLDYHEIYRQIITDKYTALVEIAKQKNKPEQYIEQKYFDSACSWYASDLTKEEREIGYRNEMSVLRKGTTQGLDWNDSFFRMNNITLPYEEEVCAELSFNRQMLNNQINNIFHKSNIELVDGENYQLSVNPYDYYISVQGISEDKRYAMERALNVGNNGVNLWRHIYNCSTRDGAKSSHINLLSYHKKQTFQDVYQYTGYKLNELKPTNETYYTSDDKDIKLLIQDAVWKNADVPYEFKEGVVSSIWKGITEIYQYGWDNIADMNLVISGNFLGLHDMEQDIDFGLGSSYVNQFLNNSQFKLLSNF